MLVKAAGVSPEQMVCAEPMAPALMLPTVTLTDAVLATHDPVVEVASSVPSILGNAG